MTKMPAGNYWIGDLCYIMHPQWDEFCSLITNLDQMLLTLSNGVQVWFSSTMFGDGEYFDQYGNNYPVDAGLIGCIKVSDICDSDPSFFPDGGHIFFFDQDFVCSYDSGTIFIGPVSIDTGDEN